MAQPNPYLRCSAAELAELRAALVAAELAHIKSGNYSLSGRSKSVEGMQISQKLAWVEEAIAARSGTRVTTTFADFSAS